MVRAFGAFRSDQNCNLRSLWRAEGPIYTSLGQRPRKRSDRKKNKGRRPDLYQPGATPQEEIRPQEEQGLKARSIAFNV